MSKRVLEVWDQRLKNWALWKLGGSGPAVSRLEEDMHPPRPPVPLVGEALDTDDLIARLGLEHRQAVTVTYLWTVPETMAARASLLRIHPDTLTDRLRSAMYRLDDMDHARRGHQRAVVIPFPQPDNLELEEQASIKYALVSVSYA